MARERFQRALEGHIESTAQLDGGSTTDAAWSFAIRCAQASAQPTHSPWPSLENLAAFEPGSTAALIALRGVALSARDATLRFEPEVARTWLEYGHTLSDTPPAGFRLASHLERTEAGAISTLDARSLRALAIEGNEAAVVVDLVVAQAWDAEAQGDVEDALSAARRASRMARTEGLPQQEYFANIMLARCRRLVGHPHLAVRILSALRGFVSTQWRPWLAWELLMAGATAAAEATIVGDSSRTVSDAVGIASRLIRSARSGARDSFDAAALSLRERCSGSRRLSADANALICAIDGCIPSSEAPAHLQDWLEGAETKPPRGLHGLAADLADSESLSGAVVFVAVVPPRAARRILGPGLGLLNGHERLTQSRRRQGRMDTAVAVLALAGHEGLSVEELFQRVYEFDYDPEIHSGALRKLLARVQEWLGPLGTVHTDAGRHRLEVLHQLVVADPRSVPPVDLRVLAVLASGGSISAKKAAKRLRIPLRTAQAALQDLLRDGTAQRVRSGNVVEYHLEDTTFSEPTRH